MTYEEAKEIALGMPEVASRGPQSGDPLGARTQDPNIKSVVLYLLS